MNELFGLIKLAKALGMTDNEFDDMAHEAAVEALKHVASKPKTPSKEYLLGCLTKGLRIATLNEHYDHLSLAAFMTLHTAEKHPEWTAEDLSRYYTTCTGLTTNIDEIFEHYKSTLSDEDKEAIERAVDKEFHRTRPNKSKDSVEGGTDRDTNVDENAKTGAKSATTNPTADKDEDELEKAIRAFLRELQ